MSTIAAISTPPGAGGIAVVRLSGKDSLSIADSIWRGTRLADAKSHTAHLGSIMQRDGSVLDRAVATVFRAPNSFTGEDTVEFSVHGSMWIQRELVELLCSNGAEPAGRGEFTRRAFMNGRLDLAQAEGVADMIAASSRAAHRLAVTQMSGEFSRKLDDLRARLIKLASLLELELDFSEEEVEFADRRQLSTLADETLAYIDRLTSTYKAGRAIKEGVPVAIAGAPNAGKSTLLNKLLDEEKAIVSDIPGTTRDIIEDTCEIDGILFRFYDTAGLRHTDDLIEKIGADRARQAIDRAAIVMWLHDLSGIDSEERMADIRNNMASNAEALHIIVHTKADLVDRDNTELKKAQPSYEEHTISSKTGEGIEDLKSTLVQAARRGIDNQAELVITNARHQTALTTGAEALKRARVGIDAGLSADFIAQDIREALHHISQVTGQITTPDLLSSIFTSFCIGK